MSLRPRQATATPHLFAVSLATACQIATPVHPDVNIVFDLPNTICALKASKRSQMDWVMCCFCMKVPASTLAVMLQDWICNSSICMTRRGLKPTGIAIFDAQQQGFASVAHHLQVRSLHQPGLPFRSLTALRVKWCLQALPIHQDFSRA